MPGSNMRTVCTEGHECSILVVDDDAVVLEVLKATFELQKNIRLLTASTLQQALEIIRLTPQLELILLDLWLENKNPIGCLQEVVKATGGRIAVIAISGDYELEDAAYKNGAIDFWRKPIEVDVIGRAKLSIMNQRKQNVMLDRANALLVRNTELVKELDVIRGKVKSDPDEAIEELDVTTRELKQDIQTLLMRAT